MSEIEIKQMQEKINAGIQKSREHPGFSVFFPYTTETI